MIVENFKKIDGHKAIDFCRKYLSATMNEETQDLIQKDLRELGVDNYCLGTCIKKNEISFIGFKFIKEDEFTKACDTYCEFISYSLRMAKELR